MRKPADVLAITLGMQVNIASCVVMIMGTPGRCCYGYLLRYFNVDNFQAKHLNAQPYLQ